MKAIFQAKYEYIETAKDLEESNVRSMIAYGKYYVITYSHDELGCFNTKHIPKDIYEFKGVVDEEV